MGQYSQAIQKLYVAYFNRAADPGGLAYWEDAVVRMNGDTSAVSAAFGSSKEYKDTYANLSEEQVVNKVYQNLFGRSGEESGVKFWANNLRQKNLSIDNVVTAVAKGAQGSDAYAYQAKVEAAAGFTLALNTPQKAKAYSGDAANAIARSYLSGVTDSMSAIKAAAMAEQTVFNLLHIAKPVQSIQLQPGANTVVLNQPNEKADTPILIENLQGQLKLSLRPQSEFRYNYGGGSEDGVDRVVVSELGSLADAANTASRLSANQLKWFSYRGDTYLVVNNDWYTYSYNQGKDWLIKFQGWLDLSSAVTLSPLLKVLNINFAPVADMRAISSVDTQVTGSAGSDQFSADYTLQDAKKAPAQLKVDGGTGYDYLYLTAPSDEALESGNWQLKNIEYAKFSSGAALSLDTRNWQGLQLLEVKSGSDVSLQLGTGTDLKMNLQPWTFEGKKGTNLEIDGGRDLSLGTCEYQHIAVGTKTAASGDVVIQHTFDGTPDNSLQINGGRKIKADLICNNISGLDVQVQGNAATEKVIAGVYRTPFDDGLDLRQLQSNLQITDVNFAAGKAGTIDSIEVTGFRNVLIQDHGLRKLKVGGFYYGQIELQNAKDSAGSLIVESETRDVFNLTDQGGVRKLQWTNQPFMFNGDVHVNLNLPKLEQLVLGGAMKLDALELKNLPKLTSLSLFDDVQINGSLNLSSLRVVNAYGNSGLNMFIDPGLTEFHGGNGDDTLRLAANSHLSKLQTIDGGAGNNTLILSSSQKTFLQNNKLLEKFVGFNNIVVDDSVQAQGMDSTVVLTGQAHDGALLNLLH